MKNIIYSPLGLYCLWIVICSVLWLCIPFLSMHSASSAQVPFVLGTYVIVGIVCGAFLISLLNMILFRGWVKKFWYINGSVTLITGGMIVYFLIKIITL